MTHQDPSTGSGMTAAPTRSRAWCALHVVGNVVVRLGQQRPQLRTWLRRTPDHCDSPCGACSLLVWLLRDRLMHTALRALAHAAVRPLAERVLFTVLVLLAFVLAIGALHWAHKLPALPLMPAFAEPWLRSVSRAAISSGVFPLRASLTVELLRLPACLLLAWCLYRWRHAGLSVGTNLLLAAAVLLALVVGLWLSQDKATFLYARNFHRLPACGAVSTALRLWALRPACWRWVAPGAAAHGQQSAGIHRVSTRPAARCPTRRRAHHAQRAAATACRSTGQLPDRPAVRGLRSADAARLGQPLRGALRMCGGALGQHRHAAPKRRRFGSRQPRPQCLFGGANGQHTTPRRLCP